MVFLIVVLKNRLEFASFNPVPSCVPIYDIFPSSFSLNQSQSFTALFKMAGGTNYHPSQKVNIVYCNASNKQLSAYFIFKAFIGRLFESRPLIEEALISQTLLFKKHWRLSELKNCIVQIAIEYQLNELAFIYMRFILLIWICVIELNLLPISEY